MMIANIFFKLTMRTYPHGTEQEIFELMDEFSPVELLRVEGNLIGVIGENPDVMFCSHLDTFPPLNRPQVQEDVEHFYNYEPFYCCRPKLPDFTKPDLKPEIHRVGTNGKTILGADDKAGVSIMLEMMQKEVPGVYAFFYGEEVGLLGSRQVAEKYPELCQTFPFLKGVKKVVAFDRCGTNDVITHQRHPKNNSVRARCCSDDFANALCGALNTASPEFGFSYRIFEQGHSSDSRSFMDIMPECTNISVGYFDQHTNSEYINMAHLARLTHVCCQIDWSALPVVRKPGNA